jgi:ATPase family associated with various cellular activities (AAA)
VSTARTLWADQSALTAMGPSGGAEPAWLEEVRLRAARRVTWLRHLWSNHRYEGEEALAISHSEVDRALLPPGLLREAESAFYRDDPAAGALSAALEVLAGRDSDTPWEHLRVVLSLEPAEQNLLALCLAGAADPAIRRVFGYLMDAAAPASPTPALAATLFDLPPFWSPGPGGALVRWRLARPADDGRDPYTCSTGWEADALLLAPLLRQADSSLTLDWSAGSAGSVTTAPAGEVLRPEMVEEIVAFVRSLRESIPPRGSAPQGGAEIEIVGPPGSGRKSLAAAAAARLAPGRDLMTVPSEVIAGYPDPASAVVKEIRRSLLEGRPLMWERADALPPAAWAAVGSAPLTFLSSTTEVPVPPGSKAIRRTFRVAGLTQAKRNRLWTSLDPAEPPPPVRDWDLRPGEIAAAAAVLPAGEHAVREVCRRMLFASTPELLTALPLPYTWEDLVISPRTERHLRELDAQARNRPGVLDGWGLARLTSMGRGVTALFAGPSGTGKTMAAQVLARSLGVDLYRVDLAGMVSKYIGETEKHLRQVFDACERAPILLLFDEADALFGKRTEVKDAHDRYANIEIDYILQRMETFNGTAILATNRKGDLDTAFVRRIQFIVDFFPPTPAEREHLWRLALQHALGPDGAPLAGELDWRVLGSQFDLTGAGIKAAALAAAFLARTDGTRIEMTHVLAATRRELEKHGKVMRSSEGARP